MPFVDPVSCEPLRIFSRLEPRPRSPDFDRALRAEVHDPLWMVGRQWQFGEFHGEDAGSAVLVKVALRTARIDGLSTGGSPWRDVPPARPLETEVERLPIDFDLVARADSGAELLAILDARGAEHDGAGAGQLYAPERARYHQVLRDFHPFTLPAAPGPSADPAVALAAARLRGNARAYAARAALAGRALDGVSVLRSLPAGPLRWAALPAELALQVLPDHAQLWLDALGEFRDWFAGLYPEPGPGEAAWNSSQLEYQFAARVPRPDGTELALVADEYDSGRLEWYAFDLGPRVLGPAPAPELPGGEVRAFSVIPSPAEFPGMPRPRWWQLEDGSVDLGNIRGTATDLAKVLVAEFALLYGNNWFVIPCRQEVGTLAEIEGLVVTDVFGIRTLSRPVNAGSGTAWTSWDFFSLSRRESPSVPAASVGAHLFLPPTLAGLDEGEPVEEVVFLRDEMANAVWAVERRVPDGLGRGRDGNDAARQVRNALLRIGEELDAAEGVEPPAPAPDGPGLRYVLGTTVPENWIPLVPVHKPLQDRAIRLQRAAMPRFFRGKVRPVRPVTELLRTGLGADDVQRAPWFLEEEEVPREGTVVVSTFQRARWLGGRNVVWLGRRGRSGRGAGGSGLRYDLIKPSERS